MDSNIHSSNKKYNLLYSPSSNSNSNSQARNNIQKQYLTPQSQSRSSSQSSSHVTQLKMGAAMNANQSFERHYAGSVIDNWKLKKISEFSFPTELGIKDQFKSNLYLVNNNPPKDHLSADNNQHIAGSSLAQTHQRINQGFVENRSKTAAKISRSSKQNRQKTTEEQIVNGRFTEVQNGYPTVTALAERSVTAMNHTFNNNNKNNNNIQSPDIVLDCLQVFQREDPKLAKRLDKMLRSTTPQQSQSRIKNKDITEMYIPDRDIKLGGMSLVKGKHKIIGQLEEQPKQRNLTAEDIFTQTKRKLLNSWRKEAEEQQLLKEQENQFQQTATQQRQYTFTLLHRANELVQDNHNQSYNLEQQNPEQLINSSNKHNPFQSTAEKSCYNKTNIVSRRQSSSMNKRPSTRSTFYERFNKKLLESRRFSNQYYQYNNTWAQQDFDYSQENLQDNKLDGVESGLRNDQNWAVSSVLESSKECEKLVSIFVNKSIICEDTLWKQRKQRMQEEQLLKNNDCDIYKLNDCSHEMQEHQEILQTQQEHEKYNINNQQGQDHRHGQIIRSRIFKQASKESQQLYQRLVNQNLRL